MKELKKNPDPDSQICSELTLNWKKKKKKKKKKYCITFIKHES